MKKLPKLKWFVYVDDINRGQIISFNILNHSYFLHSIEENFKKNKADRQKFEEQLERDLRYCFWSKTEHEVVISDMLESGVKARVDVYDQVHLNWDIFVSYVFDNLS